ncbi:MAG: flagellar biosynthetic protein FliP, partial [Halieaceae bacterium]
MKGVMRVVLLLAIWQLPGLVYAEQTISLLTVEPTSGGGSNYSINVQILILMTVLSLLPAALL